MGIFEGGYVSNGQIYTNDQTIIFKQGNYLGIAGTYDGKPELFVTEPLHNPVPLQLPAKYSSSVDSPEQMDEIVRQFESAGCTASLPSNSQTITRQISQAPSTIQNLPNGNYRFCSKPFIPQASTGYFSTGYCFLFRKVGSRIVGDYYLPHTDSGSICISGTLKNNTVTGEAWESKWGLDNPPTATTEMKDWDDDNRVRVRAQKISNVNRLTSGFAADIHYNPAIFNLQGLHRYNAGTTLPPQSCPSN
jgi:hypothetical protein